MGGYTKMVEHLLEGIEVRLGIDYLEQKEKLKALAGRLVYCAAISLVRSVEPVSTMMISSIMEATESRHLARTGSSFLTIIHKLIVIIITDGPSEVFLLYYTILQQFYIEIKKYTCIFFEPWL